MLFITEATVLNLRFLDVFFCDFDAVMNASFWKFQRFDADVKMFVMTTEN